MRDKSLIALRCRSPMSCGISVRFQTLSPSQRQVAHALLTRPPLSFKNASRRINSQSSVRLECVMHAASVHPEPGSNSRMFVFNLSHLSSNLLSSAFSSFSYFCLSCICSLRNFRVPFSHILYACTSLFVVQFSMTVSLPLFRDSFVIISHQYPFVNTFFKLF